MNVVGGAMQNQQAQQQQQWFNKQQQMQQQQQQQQQPNQQILIQRQMPGQMQNMGMGPGGYMARPRQPQMGGMNQGGYQNVFNAEQQQGMKPNQNQPGATVSVLSSQLQGGGIQHQVVMGPPGSQHATMQQQMMQNVRSPPPITSPQAQPSPRPAPSPRAQPSPHHLPSHSPAPGGDMHNHLGHHQSPLPAMGDAVMGDNQLNAQEQLSKFVEKL